MDPAASKSNHSADFRTSANLTDAANIALRELQTSLRPKIVDLVRRQRIRFLATGTRFPKYSSKGQRIKDKFWFCCLSANQDALHYGDCDGDLVTDTKELKNKFPVSEIRDVTNGRECPHSKDMRSRKGTNDFTFCIIPVCDQDAAIHFVVPDEKTFAYWTDGLNCLLGREMSSSEAAKDMETLQSMYLSIQLLELEGVSLPQQPPQVPPLPPNFDFILKY